MCSISSYRFIFKNVALQTNLHCSRWEQLIENGIYGQFSMQLCKRAWTKCKAIEYGNLFSISNEVIHWQKFLIISKLTISVLTFFAVCPNNGRFSQFSYLWFWCYFWNPELFNCCCLFLLLFIKIYVQLCVRLLSVAWTGEIFFFYIAVVYGI